MGHVQVSRLIPASQGDVFRYVTDLGHLPEWLDLSMEVEFPAGHPVLRAQSEFHLKFMRFGRSIDATFRVDTFLPRERLAYRQISGFFKSWEHTTFLSAHDAKTTLLTDVVDFRMPYGVFGALVDDLYARADFEKLLRHRQMKIEERFLGPA